MNLKELSQLLNLSQTTVSRALNGYPEVKIATRERVMAAAKQYNYSPNTRAKGLATGRAYAIGHMIPRSDRHEIVNPIFGDFIAGAGETYAQRGYDLVLNVVDDSEIESAYRAQKIKGNVDGTILHGPLMDDPRIPLLQELGIPFAVHGRASDVPGDYTWLDVNSRRAFQRATGFLLDLGHRRIALINGIEAMDFATRRRQGYEDALTARGLRPDPALHRSGEMTEGLGYRAASEMLDGPRPPTGFVVSSLISALGVRRAVRDRGLRMGRDVSVITHDDVLSYMKNGEDEPIFTATRSSVREAGRLLAGMLIDKIEGKTGETHKLLEAELVLGASTGPAPG